MIFFKNILIYEMNVELSYYCFKCFVLLNYYIIVSFGVIINFLIKF